MYDKPCCYFYIEDDGTVAYVGKANGTLKQRVYSHSKEEKFDCAHIHYTIKYVEFDRASDMDVAEKCYIKSLKPRLNVVDNTDGFFPNIGVDFDAMRVYVGAHQTDAAKRRSNCKKNITHDKEYSLPSVERELLLFLMDKTDRCRNGHTFSMEEICKITDIEYGRSGYIDDLKEMILRIANIHLCTKSIDGRICYQYLLSSTLLNYHTNTIEIEFDERLYSYLLKLYEEYTQDKFNQWILDEITGDKFILMKGGGAVAD